MTDLLHDVDLPSDAELISSVRGGDVAAYGELFSRHRDAAHRLARQLVRGPDSDDLVAEAFAKVLTVLQGGGGPDVAFRAYLLTAVRRLHVDRVRLAQRLQTTDDMTPFDPGVPFRDTAVAGFESGAAARAFASLPERWQLVLWHLEVEGQKPADVAPLLGMSANSVSALAYRAREGLRQAFLTMHLADISETECRWVNEHLGGFVRKGLSKRDAGKVQAHLDGCRRCTAMHLELTEVNSDLAALIAPLVLGAAAAGYLASSGAGAAGLLALVSRLKDLVVANSTAATAAGVSVGVAAAAVAAVTLGGLGSGRPTVTAAPSAGPSSVVVSPTGPGATPPAGTGPAPASPSASPPVTPSASPFPSPTVTPSFPLLAPSGSPSPTPAVPPPPLGEPTLSPAAPSLADPSLADPSPADPSPADPSPADPSPADPSTPVPAGPGTGETPPPGPAPDPEVGSLVVDPAGSVLVNVTNMRPGDVLEVSMTSADTTFPADPAALPPGCTATGTRRVVCAPALAVRAGGRAAAVPAVGPRDYTVTLPLAFPDSMVDDDLEVTARLGDTRFARSLPLTFHPSRRPTYDVSLPALGGLRGHVLVGEVDRWSLGVPVVLPPRVRGMRYTVTAPLRLDAVDGCDLGAAGSTLTCPDVRHGDEVTLALVAEGLTAGATAEISAGALVDFLDPDSSDQTRAVDLPPGADLSLRLGAVQGPPARDGSVTVPGRVRGLRPGLQRLTYRVGPGAGFTDEGNPGCTVAKTSMTCPAPDPDSGSVTLALRATDRLAPTDATVTVEPTPPFEAVGDGPHTADVTLPSRPGYDFAMGPLTETAHTVDGATDSYVLSSTVRAVPAGTGPLTFEVSPGAVLSERQAPGCTVLDPTRLACGDLGTDRVVDLSVQTTETVVHDVTVTLQVPEPYDDPDPSNDVATATGLRPGTHLELTPHELGVLHQDADGTFPVTVQLAGTRAGMPSVRYRVTGPASFAPGPAGCVPAGDTLTCPGPRDGPRQLALRPVGTTGPAPVTLTAEPGGDFVGLGTGAEARTVLAGSWDFALTGLATTAQTLAGGTDRYTLRASVGPLPEGLDAVRLVLTGDARLAGDQAPGCTRVDDSTLSCTGVGGGGPVDVAVESTGSAAHPVALAVRGPATYDDPTPGNDARDVTLRPGADLHLADLRPDNASPANDDDEHLVSTRLTGVPSGLGAVRYRLTGAAVFVRASAQDCTVTAADPRLLTCAAPGQGDGSVTLTIRSDDPHVATDLSLAVAPEEPFVETAPADNEGTVRLAPRPTYDFSVSGLGQVAHTVSGGADTYLLDATVGRLPVGLDTLDLVLTRGGAFAAAQEPGCSRVDDTRLRCTDLASARAVRLRVTSTSTVGHPVTVAVRVPTRYDDPAPGNDSAEVTVLPGVDLAPGALTPSPPVRADGDTYQVRTVLRGTRGGPVTFSLTGAASLTGSSCTRDGSRQVTCADPVEGQSVSFTLTPDNPTAATPVTLRAQASAPLVELAAADNAVSTTLAADLAVESVTVTDHGGDGAVAHVQLGGIPGGVARLQLQISGADVGTGAGQTHLTGGAAGADGQGAVDCDVTGPDGTVVQDGVWATCRKVDLATRGRFLLDLRLAHVHGTDHTVVFAVLPAGVDQAGQTGNDRMAATFR